MDLGEAEGMMVDGMASVRVENCNMNEKRLMMDRHEKGGCWKNV